MLDAKLGTLLNMATWLGPGTGAPGAPGAVGDLMQEELLSQESMK